MKRKKVISGSDEHCTVTITIDMDAPTVGLGREESQRMMDALAGKVMKLFQDSEVPFLFVPLVRLRLR